MANTTTGGVMLARSGIQARKDEKWRESLRILQRIDRDPRQLQARLDLWNGLLTEAARCGES